MKRLGLAIIVLLFVVYPTPVDAQMTRGFTIGGTCRVLEGSFATPEGNVRGKPCDIYVSRLGGQYATYWVKETGTIGTTGWVALRVAPQKTITLDSGTFTVPPFTFSTCATCGFFVFDDTTDTVFAMRMDTATKRLRLIRGLTSTTDWAGADIYQDTNGLTFNLHREGVTHTVPKFELIHDGTVLITMQVDNHVSFPQRMWVGAQGIGFGAGGEWTPHIIRIAENHLRLNNYQNRTSWFTQALVLDNNGWTKPTCDAALITLMQGLPTWITRGTAGVADTIEVCMKSSTNTYSWRPWITG